MGGGIILMNNNIKFDISNLFAKKEVLISKSEIVEIVYFAIQNGIVKVEAQNTNDETDENYIELQATGLLKLGYNDTNGIEVLIKPFDYKEEDDCPSCHGEGEGEYETRRGSSSHFIECHCQKEK